MSSLFSSARALASKSEFLKMLTAQDRTLWPHDAQLMRSRYNDDEWGVLQWDEVVHTYDQIFDQPDRLPGLKKWKAHPNVLQHSYVLYHAMRDVEHFSSRSRLGRCLCEPEPMRYLKAVADVPFSTEEALSHLWSEEAMVTLFPHRALPLVN